MNEAKQVCNVCGKVFDQLDEQENFGFDYHVGYGSRYDLTHLKAHICIDCFDKLMDGFIPLCKISPDMACQRKGHKQNEWSGKDDPALTNFIAWVHTLPLADELIFLAKPVQKQSAKVICISGQARAGKDTTAAMMKKVLEETQHQRVLIIHYADLLKFMCKSLFGWDGQKDEAGRHILQYVGTDVIRKQEPDFWVAFIIKVLSLFPNEWDYVLVPDARFPNEISELRKAGFDVRHVHVSRPIENGLTEEQRNHISETALNTVVPDESIENNGSLEELSRRITDMVFGWQYEKPAA